MAHTASHDSTHDHGHGGHGGGHGHHITPIRDYVKVFVFLLIMMVLTIAAAKAPYWGPTSNIGLLHNSWVTNLIALGIASAKAVAVIMIFMGVKHASTMAKFYAILGFVWFTLFYVMFCDYATRQWEPVRGWEDVPSNALPRGAGEKNRIGTADPDAERLRDIYRE